MRWRKKSTNWSDNRGKSKRCDIRVWRPALRETRPGGVARPAVATLHRWIKRSGVPLELTARPWNRFEPLNTEWWLIPSTEWPAYRHGKFFFKAHNDNRDLYCGLFVEKGLDPSIAAAFPTGKRLVMDNTWTWHRLLAEIESGIMDAALLETTEHCHFPLHLVIDGGFVEDPGSYDPYAPPMDWNYVTFESDGTTLQHKASTGDQFAHLSTCRDLMELARAIRGIPHLEWTWIDFHVGVELEMAPLERDAGRTSNAWDASALWHECLAPWRSWVI